MENIVVADKLQREVDVLETVLKEDLGISNHSRELLFQLVEAKKKSLQIALKGEDVTSNQVAKALYDASNLEREYSILKTVLDEDMGISDNSKRLLFPLSLEKLELLNKALQESGITGNMQKK